jgi:WD40 repeat protein
LVDAPNPYAALAFSPDGTLLAAAQKAGTIRLFRPADGGDLGKLDVGRVITQLAFSPDGSLLAARSADGALTIWRLADHVRLSDLQTDPDDPNNNEWLRVTPSLIFSFEGVETPPLPRGFGWCIWPIVAWGG